MPLALRIAVHLCEVIETEDDIYGDGVNIAARLQEHAEPGGIVLSEVVHDVARVAIGSKVRDLGFLMLKNIEHPVHAYALDPETPGLAVPARPPRKERPSIAVLPLQNLGGNPEDGYFADGIVEDIVVSLAALRELLVIARASTLIYRGKHPDLRHVANALGVRYVLMGSVRRSQRSVRVSTELCDALTGATLWGDNSEVEPGELFDVQDKIVARIVAGIAPHVRAAELSGALRKRPESFTAYDYTLRALDIMNNLDPRTFGEARTFLDRAIAEDPNFAMPAAWAARWHSIYVGQGWSPSPEEDSARAVQLAGRAIELDQQNALALATYGHLKSFLFHDYDSGLVYLERALSVCPNHALAWILSSATLSYVGRAREAVENAERGLRLSPFDRSLYSYYMFLGLAHYAGGNYEEAVKWGRMSASENPSYTANNRILAAALAALDRTAEAHDVVTRMLQLEPHFRLVEYERTRQPFRNADLKTRYMEHLRKAGLPE